MDLPERILLYRPTGYGCSVGVSMPLYKSNAVPLARSLALKFLLGCFRRQRIRYLPESTPKAIGE
jgi:hypothetical protein